MVTEYSKILKFQTPQKHITRASVSFMIFSAVGTITMIESRKKVYIGVIHVNQCLQMANQT